MQLPSATVRTQMSNIAFPLKIEMLRSSTLPLPASSAATLATKKARRKSGTSLSMLMGLGNKSSSSLSASPTGSPVDSPPTTLTSRPQHTRSRSATILAMFTRPSSALGSNTLVAPSSPGKERTRGDADPSYWAVRLRSTRCKDLGVKEIGALRGSLRAEGTG